MIVAVTGATGHVGANLVRTLLARGDQVRALARNDTTALRGLEVEHRSLDITDHDGVLEALAGVDVVFHLAAHISIRDGDQDEEILQRTNVDGVRNVVEACKQHGVKRLVHFSSIHAIVGDDPGRTVDETCELALGPDCAAYDRSKAGGEGVVLEAVAAGLDAVIVNPTSIVGPNDFKPSPQAMALLGMARHRFLPIVNAGYDWVDVRDVVDGALLALERGRAGERYILGNQRQTFREIADKVEHATGIRVVGPAIPLWSVRTGVPFARLYAAITGGRQLLTAESIRILGRHLAVSCDKARRELGYAPRPFQETVTDTFAWFREAGLLS